MWKWYSSLHLIPPQHFSSYLFFFNFLQNFILFCYKNDYSFHLSHLFWCTLLFMEDTNFVINNIRILIRLNFSEVSQRRHCIADITKNCFVGFVAMFEKEKWICWKIINTYEQRIIKSEVITKVFGFQKLVKHCQQKENPVILKKKNALCVKKNECVVGHLPLRKAGNFAKTIFYFLKAGKIQHMWSWNNRKAVQLWRWRGNTSTL